MRPEPRTTARLRLSPVAMADVDAFVDLEGQLRRTETPPRDAPDPEVWAGYLKTFVAVWDGGELGYWKVEHDGRVAGFGGVKPKRWRGHDCWNLYYRLYPRAQGLGFATEVAREAVVAATQEHPDWPVLAETRPTNDAAIAVARRVGLVRRPDLDADGWAVLLRHRRHLG